MNEWVKVGARCVCVSTFWTDRGIDGPFKGEICTVSEIYVNAAGLACLRFVEHYGWYDEDTGARYGYSPRRFRPLVEQSDDVALFTHHLTDQPVDA